MIRDMNSDDRFVVMDALYDMQANSPTYGHCPADEEFVEHNLKNIIPSENFIGLIDSAGRGFMLGMMGSQWFDPTPHAYEQMLYVAPKWRGSTLAYRLIQAFTNEADRRGAHSVFAATSTGIATEACKKLYYRLGFQPHGEALRKKLR